EMRKVLACSAILGSSWAYALPALSTARSHVSGAKALDVPLHSHPPRARVVNLEIQDSQQYVVSTQRLACHNASTAAIALRPHLESSAAIQVFRSLVGQKMGDAVLDRLVTEFARSTAESHDFEELLRTYRDHTLLGHALASAADSVWGEAAAQVSEASASE